MPDKLTESLAQFNHGDHIDGTAADLAANETIPVDVADVMLQVEHSDGVVREATAREVGRICTGLKDKSVEEIIEAAAEHNAMMQIINQSKNPTPDKQPAKQMEKAKSTTDDDPSSVKSIIVKASNTEEIEARVTKPVTETAIAAPELLSTTEDYRDKARRLTAEKFAVAEQAEALLESRRAIEQTTKLETVAVDQDDVTAREPLSDRSSVSADRAVRQSDSRAMPLKSHETAPVTNKTAAIAPTKDVKSIGSAEPGLVTYSADIASEKDETQAWSRVVDRDIVPFSPRSVAEESSFEFAHELLFHDEEDMTVTESMADDDLLELGMAEDTIGILQGEVFETELSDEYAEATETEAAELRLSEQALFDQADLHSEVWQEVQPAIHQFVESLREAALPLLEAVDGSDGSELSVVSSVEATENVDAQSAVYEKLEVVLIELFENLEVELSPEAIEAFIASFEPQELIELITQQPADIDTQHLSMLLGTDESMWRVKHALSSIKQSVARNYRIGASIMRAYTISFAA